MPFSHNKWEIEQLISVTLLCIVILGTRPHQRCCLQHMASKTDALSVRRGGKSWRGLHGRLPRAKPGSAEHPFCSLSAAQSSLVAPLTTTSPGTLALGWSSTFYQQLYTREEGALAFCQMPSYLSL